MAFIRRKGNAYYLVHNVRRAGRVKQLHLARLGDRPRITDEVVSKVSKSHPLLALNWSRLREQVRSRVELFDPKSEYWQELARSLRDLNMDLAELFPPLLKMAQTPEATQEIVSQLRLLRTTLDIKLTQFEQADSTGLPSNPQFPVGG